MKSLRKYFIIALIFIIGGFIAVLLSIGTIRSQITQMVGLAVAETQYKWNQLKDMAQGDNLTSGVSASGMYGYDGTNFDRVRINSAGYILVVSSPVETTLQTLLNAVTVPTTGTAVDLGYFMSKHTWEIVVGGAPANHTTNLEGSINNTTWYALDSSITTTSEMRHVVNKPVRYIRADCTALPSGTCTIRYMGGGN